MQRVNLLAYQILGIALKRSQWKDRHVCQIEEEDSRRGSHSTSEWCSYPAHHQQGIHHLSGGWLGGWLCECSVKSSPVTSLMCAFLNCLPNQWCIINHCSYILFHLFLSVTNGDNKLISVNQYFWVSVLESNWVINWYKSRKLNKSRKTRSKPDLWLDCVWSMCKEVAN